MSLHQITLSVQNRVFETVELLESILLYLPPIDILLSQRVAKCWRQTVEGSWKLEEALFFRSIGHIAPGPNSAFYLNPMIKPVFRYLSPHYRRPPDNRKMSLRDSRGDHPILRRNASWKRMYLTQPPFQHMTLQAHEAWYGGWEYDHDPVRRMVTYYPGVGMLDFFEQSEELLEIRRIVDVHDAIGHFRNLHSYAQLEAMDGRWPAGRSGAVLSLRGDYSAGLR